MHDGIGHIVYPLGRHPPGQALTSPLGRYTPRADTPTQPHGQRAGGTHPTGMYSCHDWFQWSFSVINKVCKVGIFVQLLMRIKWKQLPISGGGGGGTRGRGPCPCPSGPVKICHKKDGHRRRPHRFHVSRLLPIPFTFFVMLWINIQVTDKNIHKIFKVKAIQ